MQQIAMYEAQTGAQAEETKAAKEALSEVTVLDSDSTKVENK